MRRKSRPVLEAEDELVSVFVNNGRLVPANFISSSVLTLILAFLSPVFGAEHKLAEHGVSAVVLLQKSFVYGKLKTTLARDAVRIEAIGRDWVLVARAPNWKVGFYNTRTKKALEMSFNDYIHHEIQYSYLKGIDPFPKN
jgi:hypothetical protein